MTNRTSGTRRSLNDEVLENLSEIEKRRRGYAFGGPEIAWCDPGSSPGIHLPVDPNDPNSTVERFTGCRKYRDCDLIPDSARWHRWEDLSQQDREALNSAHCYRASRPSGAWDSLALQSRATGGADAIWIGNPFGVRNEALGQRSRELPLADANATHHRDLDPCPIGGCITFQRSNASTPPGAKMATRLIRGVTSSRARSTFATPVQK